MDILNWIATHAVLLTLALVLLLVAVTVVAVVWAVPRVEGGKTERQRGMRQVYIEDGRVVE